MLCHHSVVSAEGTALHGRQSRERERNVRVLRNTIGLRKITTEQKNKLQTFCVLFSHRVFRIKTGKIVFIIIGIFFQKGHTKKTHRRTKNEKIKK